MSLHIDSLIGKEFDSDIMVEEAVQLYDRRRVL